MTSPYYSVVPHDVGTGENPYAEVGKPTKPVPVEGYVNYNFEVCKITCFLANVT